MTKTKNMKQKITKDMTIAEVVENFPDAVAILMGFGFHCAGCPSAKTETIEELAKSKQLNRDELFERLKKAIKSKNE